ncbi:MAG: CusA/CzcA family heavy metal efflux RND transporter [Bacteroidetes bacterium]|nr:CusA/CzcA family heavy metal efflux RND transporter [Bacteroidota bacterium]
MIKKIIEFSVNNKFFVLLGISGMIFWGVYALRNIPIDAVPDITNNQVQIITTSKNLSTQDVEQFLTYPVELEMANIPGVKEIRSVSKFGLSVVTVVFEDEIGTFLPRQLITEKLKTAEANIPQGFGTPFMGPITTGLGEIYQYTLDVKPGYEDTYSSTDLRTIQDWQVKRQLSGIPGVVEINTWGGHLKQYEAALDPNKLKALNISATEVFDAIEYNNSIGGGGYIEKSNQAYFIRGEGLITSLEDIENIVVKTQNGLPVLVKDIAEVRFGTAPRFGAITGNGTGEKVMGQIMLLKDASSSNVLELVKERVKEIQKTLPEGVYINPFLERSELIGKTTFTVAENLILGALITIVIVILLLGNFRAGIIISSLIPLCLLFAIALMQLFGISANLMSLGAIDFGIIIDGAIIIVEFVFFSMNSNRKLLDNLSDSGALASKKDEITVKSSAKMMRSAMFGQLIILIVFIPILALSGIEGKMFRPMALTFCFALIGALILSLTYIPVMAALFIKPPKKEESASDRFMNFLARLYDPVIKLALRFRMGVVALSVFWLGGSFYLFTTMGGEFVPTLDEGDMVIQPIIPTGTSLTETIELTTKIEKILVTNFPEIEQVVSRIGAAEIPTDPMSMEEADVIIKLRPKSEWENGGTKEELIGRMREKLSVMTGIDYEFTQPIEMRFNELITGVRADLAIKIYGHDLEILARKANEIKALISDVEGAEDISVEKTEGLPQMLVRYDRKKIAQHGLKIQELNDLIEIAFGGKKTGDVFEGEKKFDLVVRLREDERKDLQDLSNLFIDLPDGNKIPLREVAEITYTKGPAKISRENTKRRIVIGVNVRNRDLQSVVEEIQGILNEKLDLPDGYTLTYGGQFENMNHAKERLATAVPVALLLIFILLYFTFTSVKEALLVYAAIPLAATGGILSLWLRDLPFSISAGVGFIALFGVAVLNGIVLIEHFKEMKQHRNESLKDIIILGTKQRIRPVLLTSLAPALGFIPMAVSTAPGAEVQQPLATVVIGGLITATLLTLIVLPVLYHLVMSKPQKKRKIKAAKVAGTMALLITAGTLSAQQNSGSIDDAVTIAIANNPSVRIRNLEAEQVNYINRKSYESDKLAVTFGYGQINAAVNDYQLNFNQQFYFPTVYAAQQKVNAERTDVADAALDLSKKELELEVRATCHQLIYLNQLIAVLTNLQNAYINFENAARIRLEAGDGTLLELSLAQAKKEEVALQIRTEINNRAIYQNSLQTLLRTSDVFELSDTGFQLINFIQPDTGSLQNNPMLSYYTQLAEMTKQEIKLARSGYLPDISIGYTNQQIEGVKGLNAYSVGLRIPLFVHEKSAGVQIANLNHEIILQEQELVLTQLQREIYQLFESYKNARISLDYYENQGLKLAELLNHTAQENYARGEIEYFEFIDGLERSNQIRQNYLLTLNTANQIILRINYLMGN